MKIRWKLRMAAAQREIWTGTQLRRLLADAAGSTVLGVGVGVVHQGTLADQAPSTLLALCTALDCTPNDLFDLDTTPDRVPAEPSAPTASEPAARRVGGRSMPPV